MQLSCLKRSVGLVTAATYVMATGILTSVTLGSVKLINKAKVSELVREMAFYDNANAKFVGRYNALPGLLSYSKCMTFPEFSKNCRRQDDINLTTNEYVYKDSRCSATIGCTLQNNGADGKQAGEDVFRNFLLPMRYLKDAGLSYVKTIGLSKQLFSIENLTKQTWAESKAGDGVYVNIYNYYNVSGFGGYFLFNNNSIMGHTTSSDKSFDHYDKLMEGDNQYLVYHRFGEKRGALSVQNVKALDIKIDDGKPMTGRLTTYSTDNFSGNFAKSEYSKCITAEPSSYDVLKSIDYNIDIKTGGGGYCNFTYQLKNVAEMVNNNTEITTVGSYTPKTPVINKNNNKQEYYCTKDDNFDNNECTNSISWASNYYCSFLGDAKTECRSIIDKYCPTSNSQLSACSDSITATTTAYCRFVDGNNNNTSYCANVETKYCATETDYNKCTDAPQNNTTQKCIFVGANQHICSAITKQRLWCPSYNSEYNICKEQKTDGGNYSCTFIEQTKVNACIATLYCPNDNPQQTECSASFERNSRYACQFVDNAFNTCKQLPLRYMYCPQENSTYEGLCMPSLTLSQDEREEQCKRNYCYNNINEYSKYYCIFQNLSRNTGICDEIKTQNCSTNTAGATCNTTIPNYTCKTVNNQIIDGTCISNSKTVYCPSNNPSTDSGCTTSVSATNYYKCTFVSGNRSGNCTDMQETKYCSTSNPNTDSGCATSVSATNHYECTFVSGNRSGNCTDMQETKYCPTNNPSTDSGCATQVSVTNHYKCTFVAGNRSGNCTEQKATKYCSKKNPSKDTNCTTSADTTNYYKCTFVAGNRSGNCTDVRETKYCPENNPNTDSGCDTKTKYCSRIDPNRFPGCDTSGYEDGTTRYKCTFVAGNRSGNCTDVLYEVFCTTLNVSSSCHYSQPNEVLGFNWACFKIDKNIMWYTCEMRRCCENVGNSLQYYDATNRTNCPSYEIEDCVNPRMKCNYRGSNIPLECYIIRSKKSRMVIYHIK